MSTKNKPKEELLVPSSSGQSGNTKQIAPSKQWCFTLHYKTENEINLLIKEDLVPIFDFECSKYLFSKESGKSTQTPHLQGFCYFRRKLRPISLFRGDLKKIHWEKMRGSLTENKEYCLKEQKYLESGEIDKGKVFTNMKIRRKLRLIEEKNFYKWQKECLGLTTLVEDREIHWYYERTGNVGKSAFCKWLCVNRDCIIVSGKGCDIKYQVAEYLTKNGYEPDIVILDVPRSNLEYINYTAIEEVKNGCFASSKYESKMVIINSPKIIIFANERPDVDRMSKDRWKIHKIEQDCD